MYPLLYRCIQSSLRLASKVKLKYICVCGILIVLLDFFGAFTHMFEKTYDENFSYPYNGNIHEFVSALRHGDKPPVEPINEYNYTYLINNQQKCAEPDYNMLRIVFLVKSAANHFDRRLAIRNTWGFEKRFFDVPMRTVFIVGISPNDEETQAKINIEAVKYKDILQANFVDTYYNNTIKTMMGITWAVKYCSNSKFYMFVDDDIYVSVKNVLRFMRNPVNYPDYLKEPKKISAHKREAKLADLESQIPNKETDKHILHNQRIVEKHEINTYTSFSNLNANNGRTIESANISRAPDYTRAKRQVFDFELASDVRLFAGFVFVSSPHRHKSSKWYVSLEEYPYHSWPPYVTAGAYVLSKEALLDMYYTSLYTKHFRFDDIYLGLVAKKADIEPFHCEEFHFYKKDYTKYNYKYVITSHGYGDPRELLRVWNEQKALGNA